MLFIVAFNSLYNPDGKSEAFDHLELMTIDADKKSDVIAKLIKRAPVEIVNALYSREKINDENEESDINQNFQLFREDFENMTNDNDDIKTYVINNFAFIKELVDEVVANYGDFVKIFQFNNNGTFMDNL
jgi:hypothetical protein